MKFCEIKVTKAIDYFIGTLAFKQASPEQIIQIAIEHDFAIEFSSGMPYRRDMVDFYKKSSIKRILHNYFPAPETSFVLNIASLDPYVMKQSVTHCKQAIDLSVSSGSKFYAAHAGFCIDPSPRHLGNQWEVNSVFARDKNWIAFINSVKELVEYGKNNNVHFLVENNVIAKRNLTNDGENPLLCSDPDEILKLVNQINDPHFGLLLDTGHLKVSSQTLGFSLEDGFEKIRPYVKAIHHNDNNGLQDTNEPITDAYWFLKYMPLTKSIPHVLEVKHQSIPDIQEQIATLQLPAN